MAAALLALLLALTQANGAGWASPHVFILFAVAAICSAPFVRHEGLTQPPLLDLSLFRDRSFTGANVLILLATSVMCSLFFLLALYLQTVLGYSALASGASMLPLTVTIVVIAPLAGRLTDRIGARLPITLGMLLLAGALLGLSGLGVDSGIGSLMPGSPWPVWASGLSRPRPQHDPSAAARTTASTVPRNGPASGGRRPGVNAEGPCSRGTLGPYGPGRLDDTIREKPRRGCSMTKRSLPCWSRAGVLALLGAA